ncbi:MAG: dockerin type I repeat-containing protein [Bacteroidaceae bacterium]|nr:dockerin type I repeat-containing protein [Bacteroidaceae bacterium]MBR4783035.1 dockerin type I repeat-containing protein [Bacteroidaceae bacterium]
MKKTLLSICIMLTAIAGQVFANNDVNGNKRFTVSVSTGEGGQIEIMGTGAVSKNSVAAATINTGEDVTLVITPDENYKLASLYVDGTDVVGDVTEEGTYVIEKLSKNISVSATFEENTGIPGDVDGNGSVNSADVVAIYNFILIGEESGINEAAADVDGNGSVNSGDVVAVYNIIIGA